MVLFIFLINVEGVRFYVFYFSVLRLELVREVRFLVEVMDFIGFMEVVIEMMKFY